MSFKGSIVPFFFFFIFLLTSQFLVGQETDGEMVFDQESPTMPVYAGCESLETLEKRDECTQLAIQKFIVNNIKNPESFESSAYYEAGLTLFIRYLINEEGLVENARVVHPKDSPQEFVTEALNVVKSLPQMKPGIQQGKPVRVQYTIPIRFAR